jgi:hypothetical protein
MGEWGPKSHDFPLKFPVSREMRRESGSLETVSTAIFRIHSFRFALQAKA